MTGKAGVCLATLGPGATNLVTPAAYANLGGMPMLMITGQKPVTTAKQGLFQVVDVVDMMRPIVKYSKQIVNARNIPGTIREAFRLAQEERPGAVHIELPEDVARESVDEPLFEPSYSRRPVPDAKAITRAVEMIRSAECPMILVGAAANRNQTSKMLREFIDETGIPFFDTQMGKGVVDERHPLFLGTAALSEHDYLHCAIAKADLIINIGHDVIEKPPFSMAHDGRKVIHINNFTARVDAVYFPQLEVIGNIATSIWEIKEAIGKPPGWHLDEVMRIKAESEKHMDEKSGSDAFPIIPQRICCDVRKAMPEDGIISLDNGVYKLWFARNYKAYRPNTVLLDNALGAMGAGLPSAIAAKLVCPHSPVMAICGDGGFMMNSQEMETAVRLGVHLIVLVLRDNGYGMIKWEQAQLGFDNFGLDFGNPDFVKYAESYGAKGHRVDTAKEILPKLQECIRTPDVHLLDIPMGYSENKKVLIEELKKRTCGMR